MSRSLVSLIGIALWSASAAAGDVPRVAADIAPVHSLVARVMQGVAVPDLIVPPQASPHEYNLRPSEAQVLQDADLVFWVGADLTPWMAKAIDTLAGEAVVTELLETEGTRALPLREGALFEAHAHDDGHDGHAHAGEGEEGHGHDADTAEAAHDHAEGAGAHDAHAWLLPDNAATWLDVIAVALSAADPDNASAYAANAAAGRAEIAALVTEINALLDPVRGGRFIVFHDAYQYFEVGFAFPASGAISLSDASDPGPARIAEIQSRIEVEGVDCVLAEPQFNPGLVATVLDGTAATTGVLDPMGAGLEPGPALYPQLLRNLGAALASCF